MLNQKLNCFTGNFILPLGKPIVIVTGWETNTHLYCERFVLFEDTENKVTFKKQSIGVSIAEYKTIHSTIKTNHLDVLMNEYGKILAESDVFEIAVGIINKKKAWGSGINLRVELTPCDYQQCLLYLKWKFPKELERLMKVAQLGKLRDIIDLIKRIVVETKK